MKEHTSPDTTETEAERGSPALEQTEYPQPDEPTQEDDKDEPTE